MEVTVNSGDSLSYVWTPLEGLSCEFCPEPVAQPFDNTTYMVNVTDPYGCTAFDEITLTVDKSRNIFIPNAFTPNGDNINDVFMVYSGHGVSQITRMIVYDRWGELVFEGKNFQPNDPAFGWDGTFRGQPLNPAVFVYYVEVEFVDGVRIPYKGDVTLIR